MSYFEELQISAFLSILRARLGMHRSLFWFALEKHSVLPCKPVMQSDSDHVKEQPQNYTPAQTGENLIWKNPNYTSNTVFKLQTSTGVNNAGESRTTPIQTKPRALHLSE